MHIATRTTRPALRALVLGLALGGAVAATGLAHAGSFWGAERIQGDGVVKRETRAVGAFHGVAFDLPGEAEVHLGATEGVSLEADQNLLPLVETVIEDGVLHVRPTRHNLNLHATRLKLVVTARTLDTVDLGGSGSLTADAFKAARASVNLGGSGAITLKGVESNELSVALGGSGKLSLGTGSAGRVAIKIGGSGDVDAGQIKAADVAVTIGGSGQATVWATDRLAFTVAGSGDVHYYGDPKISKTVLGSGQVVRLGSAPR